MPGYLTSLAVSAAVRPEALKYNNWVELESKLKGAIIEDFIIMKSY